MSKYVTVSTTNTWDTKYATVSNTWAIKDTVISYFTKYTLCSVKEMTNMRYVHTYSIPNLIGSLKAIEYLG